MFCSGCGQALAPGQAFCAQCGRPSAGIIPPVPGLQFQLENYAGKVRTLSIFWFIYAALLLLVGIAGLAFAHAFLNGAPWMHGPWMNAPWMNGPFPPNFLGPALMHLIWAATLVRAAIAFAAGWGLMERTQWGRIVAIVAAILSLIKFPFGTALGIWTLVMLLGYRNSTLYEQL
ncbi:MAG: zinc ribbon domain-containing protein [Terracidiphilus sp.]